MPYKIVIATPLYPPEIGGPATYAKILEDELPKRGFEVELVKFSEVRHLPKIMRHYAYYRNVLRAAQTADVIFALDPVSVGYPAHCAAKKAKKKYIVKIVGDYAWEQGTQRFNVTQNLDEFVRTPQENVCIRLLQRIQRRVAQSAARVIVPSEYLKEVVEAWDVPSAAITVIYNTIDLEQAGKLPPEIALLQKPRIVSVGRLVPWKHMGRLIDAVSQVRAAVPASLVIVGGGPLRVALMRYAKHKLGSAGLVIGALSHRDTLAVMQEADVFVLNSSYEGFSHALIEALCLGKPIVATNVGGNPELIRDGINGLLVPVGDTVALAQTLSRVLEDGDLRAHLSRGARASAKRFDRTRMIGDTVQALMS